MYKSPIYEEIYGCIVGIDPDELAQAPAIHEARTAFKRGLYSPPSTYVRYPDSLILPLRREPLPSSRVLPWDLDASLLIDCSKVPRQPAARGIGNSQTLLKLELAELSDSSRSRFHSQRPSPSFDDNSHPSPTTAPSTQQTLNSNQKTHSSISKHSNPSKSRSSSNKADLPGWTGKHEGFYLKPHVDSFNVPSARELKEYYGLQDNSEREKWRKANGMVIHDGRLTYQADIDYLLSIAKLRDSRISSSEGSGPAARTGNREDESEKSDDSDDNDRPFLNELMRQYLSIVHDCEEETLQELAYLARERSELLWVRLEEVGLSFRVRDFFKHWLNDTFNDVD